MFIAAHIRPGGIGVRLGDIAPSDAGVQLLRLEEREPNRRIGEELHDLGTGVL
jgi:hypothetical protein